MNRTDTELKETAEASDTPTVEPEPATTALLRERGLVLRAMLVAVLALTLVGAVRWAMNVTNANARQISDNLRKVQAQMDANAAQGAQDSHKTDIKASAGTAGGNGPIIGPETEKP
jgi:hypothetical protein